MALDDAGVDARSISYVEAHGTATPLGDPIEVEGLTQAFRAHDRRHAASARIGSVKSNIGHTVAAAGAAGLIKTALALQRTHAAADAALHRAEPEDRFRALAVRAERCADAVAAPTARGAPASARSASAAPTRTSFSRKRPHASRPTPPRGPQLLVLSARSPDALAREREASCRSSRRDAGGESRRRRLHARRRPQVVRASRERRRRRHAAPRSRRCATGARAGTRSAREPKSSSCSPARARSTPAWAARSTRASLRSAPRSTHAPRSLHAELGLDLTRRHVRRRRRGDERDRAARSRRSSRSNTRSRGSGSASGVHPAAMIGHSVGEFVAATIGRRLVARRRLAARDRVAAD